jgi:alpha-glucosidase
MTRASYAGGQRYAVTWTGDNSSTWNHLKLSISVLLNRGMSGFAYSGADVGGFIGAPSPELMTRWIEIAAFEPIFRAHSEKGTPPKEPWVHGAEHMRIRRQFIEQRYRLMPYLYALADENARTGAPLMRPLFYDFPDALDAPCDQPTAFLLGDRLLIAPPPNLESSQPYEICLPAGRWYDYWTGEPVTGRTSAKAVSATVGAPMPQVITETPTLDRLPVFVRAGAILPGQPLVQSTSETPRGPLSLDVYPGDDCRGVIYADDGHSMAYAGQGYLRQRVHCAVTDAGLDLDFDVREGQFQPWWHQVEVRVHHWRGRAQAFFDGKRIADPVTQAGVLQVTIDDPSGQPRLSLKARSGR